MPWSAQGFATPHSVLPKNKSQCHRLGDLHVAVFDLQKEKIIHFTLTELKLGHSSLIKNVSQSLTSFLRLVEDAHTQQGDVQGSHVRKNWDERCSRERELRTGSPRPPPPPPSWGRLSQFRARDTTHQIITLGCEPVTSRTQDKNTANAPVCMQAADRRTTFLAQATDRHRLWKALCPAPERGLAQVPAPWCYQ